MLQELLEDNPRYFEHLFPYAVALGVDTSWIDQVKKYKKESPTWYSARPNLNTTAPDFTDFTHTYNTPDIKSVFDTRPVQHTRSTGRSGGGFSGGRPGGGIGGGGGSW